MPSRSLRSDTTSTHSEPFSRLDDPALLLELSLAASVALDSASECKAFLDILQERLGLEVAVWSHEGEQFEPECGSGCFSSVPSLAPTHPLAKVAPNDEVLITTLPDERFEELTEETDGVVVACRLGGTGLLVLRAPDDIVLSEVEVEVLRPVLEHFAASHRASEVLRATQNHLEHILDAAPDALIYGNTDRILESVNPAFESLFGYTREEATGLPTKILYADVADYEEQGRLRFNLTAAECRALFVVRYCRKDGSIFLGETIAAPVEDDAGLRVGFVGFIRDVTAREEAQAARAAENAHYESLVEVAADLIYRADDQGHFTYINPIGLRRFGYEAEELLGRHFTELVREDAHEQVLSFYRQQMDEGRPASYLEFPVLARNGEVVWIGQNLQIVWDEEGERPASIQAVARDITEQKRLNDELGEAKIQAEVSIQVKERFLATMSHEIRTPLNAVLGLSHLLNETALADEQTEYVHGIAAAADALLSLVNDVLDFARIGAEKLTFESIPFQPADLLHDLVLVMRPRAEAKGIELRLALDPSVPDELIGDPHRLRQVLINLVSNAVKFTEEGGVTIRVAPALGGEDDAIKLQFEVIDTGIGISPEQHERIFESFTQARGDDARNQGGSGLGLAIVKELVEGQGGGVSVTSEEGRGSRFVVTLPFHQGTGKVPDPKPEGYADLHGLHILLAEDIAANQFVATRMLERWGVTVSLAENGREAVEQIALQPDVFDLVLMDLQMPEMDGITATRTIRETLDLSNEHLPIVALTASVLAQQRNEVLAAGFDEFILKPFDPVHLSHRIAFLTGRVKEAERQPVNRAALERYALGDPTFIKELAALFLREVPGKIRALCEAADAGRWEQVGTLAHQSKSQAAYVGAEMLAEALIEVERLARGARPEDAAPEAKRAEMLCRAVENELEEFVQQEEEEHA